MQFEYPLKWNNRIPRTTRPKSSAFGSRSVSFAGIELERELSLLGGTQVVITSNLKTKIGGGFYAQQGRIEDAGICVYLSFNGKSKCFACDKWDLPQDNIWALKLNVSAIRGMERWGGSNFMDGLFSGFASLPDPNNALHTAPDYFLSCQNQEQTKLKYRELVKKMHPDVGGSTQEFQELKRQYEQKMLGVIK